MRLRLCVPTIILSPVITSSSSAVWVLVQLGTLWCPVLPSLSVLKHFLWGFAVFSNYILDVYHLAFPNDRRLTKCLVYGIYLIETTQTILITHDAFNDYAKGFGSLDALNAQGLKPIAVPIFTGLGGFVPALENCD